MFRKLCKYELRLLARALVPIYLALAGVAVVNTFISYDSISDEYLRYAIDHIGIFGGLFSVLQNVSIFLYFGVVVALGVLTLIFVIQRFYKGLLSDEGYLMFTLPVEPWQLIAAKGTAAFAMILASLLVAILSGLLVMSGTVNPIELFSALPYAFSEITKIYPAIRPIDFVGIYLILAVAGLAVLYQIYFAIALGHLFGKHRIMISLLAFIAASAILRASWDFGWEFLSNFSVSRKFVRMIIDLPIEQWSSSLLHLFMLVLLVSQLCKLALFFFGTERILSKKLNLE